MIRINILADHDQQCNNYPKKLFKYKPLRNITDCDRLVNLLNGKMYASHPKDFNDIFDSKIIMDYLTDDQKNELSILYETFYKNNPDNPMLPETLEDFIFNMNEVNRIICLTEINPITKDSNTQWAYYTDSYNGYVLEYDTQSIIQTVHNYFAHRGAEASYSYGGNSFHKIIQFCELIQCNYQENFSPLQNIKNLMRRSQYSLYFLYFQAKDIIWKHEKEWRLIFGTSAFKRRDKSESPSRSEEEISGLKAFIEMPKPTSIYLGYNVKCPELIKKICSCKNIEIKQLDRFNYDNSEWEYN